MHAMGIVKDPISGEALVEDVTIAGSDLQMTWSDNIFVALLTKFWFLQKFVAHIFFF